MKRPLLVIRSVFVVASLIALGTLLLMGGGGAPALAAAFAVDTTADATDANPGDGVCDDGGGNCTLRAAIQEANGLAGADPITVPAGTYTLTIAGSGEDGAATGDLDITDDLTINGAGAATTIIDAGALDRVLDVRGGGNTSSISHLTIQNGNIAGEPGAGIRNQGSLTLDNATVSANTVTGSSNDDTGGGISNTGSLGITNSAVEGNQAHRGAGIYSGTLPLTVSHTTISGNTATLAGGGMAVYGTISLTNVTLDGNSATNNGGAIRNDGALTVTDSTISANDSQLGGGIFTVPSGTVTASNVTVSGNTSDYGGGILSRGPVTLINSTLSNNSATSGGGGLRPEAGGSVQLKNTIVANSVAGGDCAGNPVTSNGNNLDSDGSCSLGGSGDFSADPKLGPLQDNGGDTLTHALLGGSPAIDTGTNTGCPAADQRGETRPVDGDGDATATCDMGAYEILTTDFCPQASEEPNESIPEAVPVTTGVVFQGCISPGLDMDYFSNLVPAGTEKIRVEMFNLPANYELILYGPDEGYIVQSDNPGTEAEMVETMVAEPGPYYMYIYGWQAEFDDVNPYYLKVSYVDPQTEALLQLEQDSLKAPYIDLEEGMPRFVDVRVPIPDGVPDDPVAQALDFLDTYQDLYRLEDPSSQLFLKRIVTDSDFGEHHMFFGQQLEGVPVLDSELAVHVDPSAEQVVLTSGNYLLDFSPGGTPSLPLPPPEVSAYEAEATALSAVSGTSLEVMGETELAYVNPALVSRLDWEDETHLVWGVNVRGISDFDGAGTSWLVLVDGEDGEVVLALDDARPDGDRPGEEIDIEGVYNTTSGNCWRPPEDDDVPWFDEEGQLTGYPGAGSDAFLDGQHAFDFAHETYHYYYDNFGRRSWDNREKRVQAMVHNGVGWRNAAYSPSCDHLYFGDGYVINDTFTHEYTHAFTEWSSDLAYQDEPGALNESFSDVFAAMVDGDWLHGEDNPTKTEDTPFGGGVGGGVGDGTSEGDDNFGGPNCDGVDSDGDGFIDEGCRETGAQCGNWLDDDGDGFVDEGCPETTGQCGNLVDDDGDGASDEGCIGSCQDGIDNGPDGAVDSADADCISRDLSDPPRKGQPDHMLDSVSGDGQGLRTRAPGEPLSRDNDWGYVHTNSGIPNKAAFLITDGGTHNGRTVTGMGRVKAQTLYYHVQFYRLGTSTDFAGFRTDMLWMMDWHIGLNFCVDDGAPETCYTAFDLCQVKNALASVGLEPGDVDCDGVDDFVDTDSDGDSIPDSEDNCPLVPNPRQRNTDVIVNPPGDGLGDACDPDDDDDGILDDGDGSRAVGDNPCPDGITVNCDDNCRLAPNDGQEDAVDTDGVGDACDDTDGDHICDAGGPPRGWRCVGSDNCPLVPNPRQENRDGDEEGGDACDPDNDNDDIPENWDGLGEEGDDPCVGGNTVDCDDNCPVDANGTQADGDADGFGDACDLCDETPGPNGDFDGDGRGDICDGDDDNDGTCDTGGPLDPSPWVPGGCIEGPDGVDPCTSNWHVGPMDFDQDGQYWPCDGDDGDALWGPVEYEMITRWRDLETPLRIALRPCYAGGGPGCPDHLREDSAVRVQTSLPFNDMEARIVDDRGFVAAHAEVGTDVGLMTTVSADSFYRFGAGGGGLGGSGSGGMAGGPVPMSEPPDGTYEGTRYYLEVLPSSQVVPGQDYSIGLEVEPVCLAPTWAVPEGDKDCDGFTSDAEELIGTRSQSACALTSTANDEALPDAWPTDFNDDQRANMQDVIFAFVTSLAPTGLNQPATGPLVRVDLNGNGFINMQDVILGYVTKLAPTGLNTKCTP